MFNTPWPSDLLKVNNMTQSNVRMYSAEELIPANLTEERPGRECNIYVLLLNYQKNRFGNPFVKIFGTDFTRASHFRKNRIYFDDCILKDGKAIDTDLVSAFDGGEYQIGKFLSRNQLPAASMTPADQIYQRKILCEISGFVKNYNNSVDFNKCFPELLTKEMILHKVRNLHDQHLINFLKRLISNCPESWEDELYENYGLDSIADFLVNNEGNLLNEFFTQPANSSLLSQNFNIRNVRLLTDNPHGNSIGNNNHHPHHDNINIMDEIGDGLSNKIIKSEELSFSDDEVNKLEEGQNNLTNISKAQNEPISSGNEFVTANDTNIIIPETQAHLGKPQIQDKEEFDSEMFQHDMLDYKKDSREFVDYYACGFSPNKDEPLLVRDISKDEITINNSFEIYLKKSIESKTIYTISFGDPKPFIFDASFEKELRLEYEPELRKTLARIYTNNAIVKMPYAVHEKLSGGDHDNVFIVEEIDFATKIVEN